MRQKKPRIFISYSHDSEEHRARVLELANRLRSDGVAVSLDRFVSSPSEGWPRWMLRQFKEADIVLCVCTETYRRRVDGDEDPIRGDGATWEGMITLQLLYNRRQRGKPRFIPVFFDPAAASSIPVPLQQFTSFDLPDRYPNLLSSITGSDVVPALPIDDGHRGSDLIPNPDILPQRPVFDGLPDLARNREASVALERLNATLAWRYKWLPLLKIAFGVIVIVGVGYIGARLLPPAAEPVVTLGISSKDAIVLRNESEHDARLRRASFAVWVDGKQVKNWQQFQVELGLNHEAEYFWPTLLAAGKRKSILKVHGLGGGLLFYAGRMQFEYCYCNERKDCWIAHGKPGAFDVKKASCPKKPRFDLGS